MTAQRGDSAAAHTDRSDADQGTFDALMARIDATPACDEDTVERVARAMFERMAGVSWEQAREPDLSEYREQAEAAIAALKPAPGTDSSGQAVQRIPQLDECTCDAFATAAEHHRATCPIGISWVLRTAAVAGPQRDHDEEGGEDCICDPGFCDEGDGPCVPCNTMDPEEACPAEPQDDDEDGVR